MASPSSPQSPESPSNRIHKAKNDDASSPPTQPLRPHHQPEQAQHGGVYGEYLDDQHDPSMYHDHDLPELVPHDMPRTIGQAVKTLLSRTALMHSTLDSMCQEVESICHALNRPPSPARSPPRAVPVPSSGAAHATPPRRSPPRNSPPRSPMRDAAGEIARLRILLGRLPEQVAEALRRGGWHDGGDGLRDGKGGSNGGGSSEGSGRGDGRARGGAGRRELTTTGIWFRLFPTALCEAAAVCAIGGLAIAVLLMLKVVACVERIMRGGA